MKTYIIIAIELIIAIIVFFIFTFWKKINKKVKIALLSLILVFLLIGNYFTLKDSINLLERYKDSKNYEQIQEKNKQNNDNLINTEKSYYASMISQEYAKDNYLSPYIPDGFNHINGSIDEGYVIQDSLGNEFVWVPCVNFIDENFPKLMKSNFEKETIQYIKKNNFNSDNISDLFIGGLIYYSDLYDECDYEKFIKSSLENGGFYISRYEMGKENDKLVSKPNIDYFKSSNYDVIKKEIENKKNDYTNFSFELINGYAYDTTLLWIWKTNDISINLERLDDSKTGISMYNNIFDLCDGIKEFTVEKSLTDDTFITRKFLKNCGYISRNASLFDEEIALRTIIYK